MSWLQMGGMRPSKYSSVRDSEDVGAVPLGATPGAAAPRPGGIWARLCPRPAQGFVMVLLIANIALHMLSRDAFKTHLIASPTPSISATPSASPSQSITSVHAENPIPEHILDPAIVQYIHFHRAELARADRENVRFLVHLCKPPKFCGGWGDRVRGIGLSMLLAMLTDRVLLIHHLKPHNLNEILQPTLIDWNSPTGAVISDDSSELVVGHLRRGTELENTTFSEWPRVVAVLTNAWVTAETHWQWRQLAPIAAARGINANSFERWRMFYADTFRTLFAPRPDLQIRIDELKQIGGLGSGFYIAMHLRLGGRQGIHTPSSWSDPVFHQIEDVDVELECAQRLSRRLTRALNPYHAEMYNEAQLPLFFSSDSTEARQRMRDHSNATVFVADVEPAHVDLSRNVTDDQFRDMLAEFYLLKDASCLIFARSSFPIVAEKVSLSRGLPRCVVRVDQSGRPYRCNNLLPHDDF